MIVLGTILVSALVCAAAAGPGPGAQRAGENLGDQPLPVGAFGLTERSGRTITNTDLADRVWIASFVFTHCPLSCPRISSVMKGLQGRLAETPVQLVSITVDPERDTPDVLTEYARKFGADANRWWFLTGPKPNVERLIVERFKLGLAAAAPGDVQAGAESFTHSDRLALVGRGNRITGYFDTKDPHEIERLVERAKGLTNEAPAVAPWVRTLPGINAALNGGAAVLLVFGWWLIRAGRVRAHATCMISGVAVSGLFLACYLVYHFQIRGGVPFRGTGPIRLVYLTILLSHVLLAMAIVPLVALTLTRALRSQFARHARIAKVTFPIWLYVSITGVVIYLMLYRLPLGPTLAS
jgi:protein SCO1/2/putative membrane protein